MKTLTGKVLTLNIYLIIFIEGFVTLSLEVQLIRQLLPFVGGSVTITSLIIGTFLIFLAAGYHSGSRIKHHFERFLKRNFSIALIFLSLGMSVTLTNYYFVTLLIVEKLHPLLPLLIYLLVVIAPLVYFLGQTIPITMNLMPQHRRAGKTGGLTLTISTLGSFLGAIIASSFIMGYLGVAMNIWINSILLGFLTLLLTPNHVRTAYKQIVFVIAMIIISYLLSVQTASHIYTKSNSYGDYIITYNPNTKTKDLYINSSSSSSLNQNNKGYAYIEMIKKILFYDLKLQGQDILVLGAGGFTLSAESAFGNQFYYVDIDPDLPGIVVPNFIKKINGTFIGKDARAYLNQTDKTFKAIVIDVYSSRFQIPSYLLTREFFVNVDAHLAPGGVAIFNVVANPMLKNAFSKRVDNTLRSVFGSCMAIPKTYENAITNILYVCNSNMESGDKLVYSDNINNSSTDYFLQ